MTNSAKTLYLDCVSGISGDMTLAALLDLGADLAYIEDHLRQLPMDPFSLQVHTVSKRGIAAKHLQIQIHHEHHHEHRRADEILAMIDQSSLPARVKQRSRAIFQAIAEAEGKIHGIDPTEVHFHEVGAMDSIIDTIGVCLALESLGVNRILASPVPTGHGKMRMAHGLYPIPAPAIAELLTGIPLAQLDVEGELTTPTGAGILKALAVSFGPLGAVTVERVGYGAGSKEFEHPNILRALLVTTETGQRPMGDGGDREPIFVLEAELDDITGETLGYVIERLLQAGALDVYYTPVYMKKNRPGTLVSVLSAIEGADRLEELLLLETTTLGVRRSQWARRILERKMVQVETPYGSIRVKQALLGGKVVRQMPEYEDVAKIARAQKVPFQQIYQLAMQMAPEVETCC